MVIRNRDRVYSKRQRTPVEVVYTIEERVCKI